MGTVPVRECVVGPKVDELASALKDAYAEFDFECTVLEVWTPDEEGVWPPRFILVPVRYRNDALALTDEDGTVLDVYITEIHGWDDIAYCVLGVIAQEMEVAIEKIVKIVIKVYEKE
jgi:hypothetical protein